MNVNCSRLISLALLLALLIVGCKNQPELKPVNQAEVFNPPPNSANLASYPKQAFINPDDPTKRSGLDSGRLGGASSMMPASFGGPGMGGMGMGGPGMGGVR